MELHCPYCNFTMNVKGARAGSFTPRCTGCQQKFALVIPEGENPVPVIKKLAKSPVSQASVSREASAQATLAPAQAPVAPPRSAAMDATAIPTAAEVSDSKRITETVPPRDTSPKSLARSPVAKSPAAQPSAAQPPTVPPVVPSIPSESSPRPPIDPNANDAEITRTLGGYQILRKLGQGGMGAVYLARQLSLDRNVAVKVLAPKLAEDAALVARFTREAFAAAQLTHHNVVQVYDIGAEKNDHFYSMEFVEGENLAHIVHRDGKLDPETAVAYTLQAARGLKFAHDRGLIHRDVKPDNLMLNSQGIIKVADLGLVKWHGQHEAPVSGKLGNVAQSAELTAFNHSMGTPAYMAPEQARDAANVDHRADIYSLGCTLYDLLTGRPPFTGKTAIEVMTKHASEPVTPPDVLSRRVPKEVSALLMKMVAKRPEERYADLGQCIVAMEDFLGTSSTGPFTPKEEHAAALEQSASIFNNTTLAKVTKWLPLGYFATCAFLALITALLGDTLASRVLWAGSFVGLGVLTAVAYIVVAGVAGKDVVLGKLRPVVFGMRAIDWLKTIAVIACVGLLLYVFDLWLSWAAISVVAVIAACVYHFAIQRPRDNERATQVEATHAMLRTMRLRGLEEDTLRQFVCKYSGQNWEAFYEALFDYDAKIEARRRWGIGLRGKPRPKFGVWRDAIISWADGVVRRRKEAREKRLLAKAEEKKLAAQGVDVLQARKTAEREAAAMMRKSEVLRKQVQAARDDAQQANAAIQSARNAVTAGPTPTTAPAAVKPADVQPRKPVFENISDEPVEREHLSNFQRRGGFSALLFGPSVRMPIAIVLLAAFALWFKQNNPDFPQKLGADTQAVLDDLSAAKAVFDGSGKPVKAKPRPTNAAYTQDLKLAILPEPARQQLSDYNVGVAGLMLLLSCFVRGWKLGALALIGAAVMVIGNLFIPGIAGFSPTQVAAFIGAVVIILGFSIGREGA